MAGLSSIIKKAVHPLLGYAFLTGVGALAMTSIAVTEPITTKPAPQSSQLTTLVCVSRCSNAKMECLGKAGSTPGGKETCELKAVECTQKCNTIARFPTPPAKPSPVPPPTTDTSTTSADIAACASGCIRSENDCALKAGADKSLMALCGRATQSCMMLCVPSGENKKSTTEVGRKNPFETINPQMKTKILTEMRKRLRGFDQVIKKLEKRITELTAAGVAIPPELTDALTKAKTVFASVQSAPSLDAVSSIDPANTLKDVESTFKEHIPNLERLANVKKIYKRIDTQMNELSTQLASDKKLAASSKTNLGMPVADFENSLAELKAAYEAAKAKIAAGDLEGGFTELQENVVNEVTEVGNVHTTLRKVTQLKTAISEAGNALYGAQKNLDRLKKAGKDTTIAQQYLDTAKQKLTELKVAAKENPVNPDTIYGILTALREARKLFHNEVIVLMGITEKTPSIDDGLTIPSTTVPDLTTIPTEIPAPAPEPVQ